MTGTEFRDALDVLKLNNSRAAAVLGIGRRSVIKYAQDEQVVPEYLRRLIVMLIKHGIPPRRAPRRKKGEAGEEPPPGDALQTEPEP